MSDGVGRETFDGGLGALRPRGTMALYGYAGGQPEPLVRDRLGGRYPLAHARRAHENLEARRTVGKLLLIP